MKTTLWTAIFATALVALPASAADKAKLIAYLDQSEKQFYALIADVNETQWKWSPAPGKWGVGECGEHMVKAEDLLFQSAAKAAASEPNPNWQEKTKGKTELLERVMPNRTGKATAPEPIVPTEHWSKEETIRRFKEVRARTRKFIETADMNLDERTLDHPFPIFNTLSAYQWLIYIPLHQIRHNGQLEDVKKLETYPSK